MKHAALRRYWTKASIHICTLLIITMASCTQYSLEVDVVFPEGYPKDDFDLQLAIYAPGESSSLDHCEAFEFNDNTLSSIASSLITSAKLEGLTTLDALPRTDRKLFIVEGYLPSGVRGLYGCQAVEQVDGEMRIVLHLQPVVSLTSVQTQPFESLVDWDASTGIQFHPVEVPISLVNCYGEPVTSTLRTKVLSASDAEVTTYHSIAAGSEDLDVHVPVLGNFRIRLTPKVPSLFPDATINEFLGFSRFRNTEITPIQSDQGMAWVAPMRFGPSGVSYIGAVASEPPVQFVVAYPTLSADSPFPSFAQETLTNLVSEGVSPEGTIYTDQGSDGNGHHSALFTDVIDGGLILLQPDLTTISVPGTTATANGEFLRRYLIQRMIYLGDCAIDKEAGPVYLQLISRAANPNGEFASSFLIMDHQGTTRVLPEPTGGTEEDEFRQFYASTCAEDNQGVQHRVLMFKANNSGLSFFDAGEGFAMEDSDSTFQELLTGPVTRHGTLPQSFTVSKVNDASVLFTASNAGFQLEIAQRFFVGSETDQSPFSLADPVYLTSGFATQTRFLPVYPTGRGTFMHLLAPLSTTNESPVPSFLLMTDFRPDAPVNTSPYSGGSFVETCSDLNGCRMLTADIDGNGTVEVYFGRSSPVKNWPEDEAPPVFAEMFRFDWPVE